VRQPTATPQEVDVHRTQARRGGTLHAAERATDALYADPQPLVTDFTFDANTSAVFDDMLHRSVPFYDEIQRMLAELVGDFAADGSNVYDLGCSTGATLANLRAIERDITLIGIDSSDAMLVRAEEALRRAGGGARYELRHHDLHQGLLIENASVVIMSLTLQFVRPLYRERLLRTVHDGLNPQGCLLLIEKVLEEETLVNRLFVKHYYDFKRRNGYAEIEIAQKREALENVLIPYRLEENRELLKAVGFRNPEIFFKWYNFCGILAVK
jgi:tRNA (cmo5U34)-methyltransferase